MFQFPGFAHLIGVTGLQPAGLPHSDTCGSIHACRSPHLFAACRVLLRRRKPRHPPSAICSFFCESMTFVFACEIVLLRPISLLRFLYLVRLSLNIVNDLPLSQARSPVFFKTAETKLNIQQLFSSRCQSAPKRRCSSHTFRYGYLVTT